MSGCAACGVTDELLFTCEHCGRQFCAAHELPHHACAGFTRAKHTPESEGWEFVSLPVEGGTTAVTEPADPEPTPSERETAPRTDRGDPAHESGRPEPPRESDRDAAKARRPDREIRWTRPPGKGLPNERGGEHPVCTWMRTQSYPAYVAKVGGLSLLFTCSYYLGLAAVIHGLPV
ncbi:hypothetical protein [Natronomonas sp. EA1]|uniref:hypothetical protein n=1 Tax=Natronomonas sp. EA1 TaxID=3421655 RepID=UPI003EB8BA08